MENLLLIAISFFAGLFLSKLKQFPKNTHLGINAFIFYVSFPALSIRYIPEMEFNLEIMYPILMPWIIFIMAVLLFTAFGKIFSWSKAVIGCLILCCGLGNTSFIGFPLLQLYYGKEAIKYGILADQPGTFMVMSTLGIFAAVYFSNGSASKETILFKILKFPPFMAFIVALLFSFIEIPTTVNLALEQLGATLSPLALFSIGTQLKWNFNTTAIRPLGLGLLYKLILAPVFIYMLYFIVVDRTQLIFKVSVIEAAMAPMITGIILAIEYKLKPDIATMFAAIGIPLSMFTTWLWFLFLR